MAKIVVICPDNGVGLTRDRNLLVELLSERHQVDTLNSRADVLERTNKKYDMAIFKEVINPRYFRTARVNVGIFNPDWFPPDWKRWAGRFTATLCKTRHAVPLFKKMGFNNLEYTGFTSEDRYNGKQIPDRKLEFLHAPGRSALKNTRQLIRIWKNNPFLPELKIVAHGADYTKEIGNTRNIVYRHKRLPDAEFKLVQNNYMFHIMPSAAEGFGHAINESRSTGAIVITTDAPPMNELVTSETGVLIPAKKHGRHNLADLWEIDELETATRIMEITKLTQDKYYDMSIAARTAFKLEDMEFRENFVGVIERYL